MSAMPVILGLTFLALFTKDLSGPKPPQPKKSEKRPSIVISYDND